MPQPNPPLAVHRVGASVPDALSRQHQIPVHVPASLHEDVFTVPLDHVSEPLVALAREALRHGRQCAERELDIARTTLADETETLYARHQLAHDRTHAAAKPGLETLQAAIDKVDAKVTALEEFLHGPKPAITAVGAVQVAEARRALGAMEPAARRAAIMAAIEANDLTTIQAITRCQPYLLGPTVSPTEMQDYATAWAKRHHGDVVAQAQVLRTVLEHLQRGGSLLLSFTVSLSSTQIASEARRLSARAAESVRAAGIDA